MQILTSFIYCTTV